MEKKEKRKTKFKSKIFQSVSLFANDLDNRNSDLCKCLHRRHSEKKKQKKKVEKKNQNQKRTEKWKNQFGMVSSFSRNHIAPSRANDLHSTRRKHTKSMFSFFFFFFCRPFASPPVNVQMPHECCVVRSFSFLLLSSRLLVFAYTIYAVNLFNILCFCLK